MECETLKCILHTFFKDSSSFPWRLALLACRGKIRGGGGENKYIYGISLGYVRM